ncbi:flagellar hook-associated protein FlgK [bacterium]|nr:flagellar hook-associated protein FlgK [bacterium]
MSFEALNLAGSALRAQRLAMDVASRNLTSASEAGYTRQTAVYNENAASGANRYPNLVDGVGGRVTAIQRVRSGLLDTVYRARQGEAQAITAPQGHLENLESRMASSPSLASRLQDLNTGLTQLQNNPSDLGLRTTFMGQLQGVTDQIRSTDAEMVNNRTQARQDLGDKVDRANQILGQLADLNPRIVSAVKDSTDTNAMLDQRDQLLDELSGMLEIQTNIQPSGEMSVHAGGAELVSHSTFQKLNLQADNSITSDSGRAIKTQNGSLGSLQDYLNVELPGYQSQLDGLAKSLITQVNAVHKLATGLDGVSGRDLLSGTGSADINLALTDPRQLAGSVQRIQGASAGTSSLVSDQPLSSQAANLTTPATASGTLRVNGTDINWTDGDSIQSLLGKLNGAGVKASYNNTSRQITLERDPGVAGPPDITVSDVSGNLSSVLGLAGRPSVTGGPGDTGGLNALGKLLNSHVFGASGSRTPAQAVSDLQTAVGSRLSSLQKSADSVNASLSDADTARRSVSGVSSDEELLNVTRLQQAYAAAAKIATAADEMLSTIIQMVK